MVAVAVVAGATVAVILVKEIAAVVVCGEEDSGARLGGSDSILDGVDEDGR